MFAMTAEELVAVIMGTMFVAGFATMIGFHLTRNSRMQMQHLNNAAAQRLTEFSKKWLPEKTWPSRETLDAMEADYLFLKKSGGYEDILEPLTKKYLLQ